MIVVLPDSNTVYGGSMYSGSPTVGDFETFIYRDLVQYIDAHYRTIPARLNRGLVGHSMGGYGARRSGLQQADVFGPRADESRVGHERVSPTRSAWACYI